MTLPRSRAHFLARSFKIFIKAARSPSNFDKVDSYIEIKLCKSKKNFFNKEQLKKKQLNYNN
ncbi:hypothetical protein PUN28_008404 [Cardiocondyla obscurior]|uniref:Uncharacterized protein n=1 Tax=Cardiocondyla obscurior TaxID=286306 RepID=A0AAW2G0A5_9HYME